MGRAGKLFSRETNDTEAIKELYVHFLAVVLTNVILLGGIILAMALLELQLMLIALLLVPAATGDRAAGRPGTPASAD